ncbi:Transmembrane 9 superfamily member [Seminavis robusta]|uniref:Transmembrane 9 superfamily member n=1 Tax=Seminavis robusta TaxID=568900 RepID=A0A9N8EV60_9STRA|nr:Transmembrane 9 superfamily member [Seminavis robusta]|eukprot:Sro1782_g297170.1 Transmembrane 9 superfamily member (728) ;mRNA; r:14158-16341
MKLKPGCSGLSTLLLTLSVVACANSVRYRYMPGVNVHSFKEGDYVKLKVNSLQSVSTQIPLDYYSFSFCQPSDGAAMDSENLGEFLAGSHIQTTPYVIQMKKDMYCEQVCIANLGRAEVPKMKPNKNVRAIRANYHHNWIVDNLPAASKLETDSLIMTRYWGGFPVGFIADDNKKAYIHNHVNIELFYHPVKDQTFDSAYRVVKFMVEPFSIKHNFEYLEEEDRDRGTYSPSINIAKIKNPIASCNPNTPYTQRPHTNYNMVVERGREPQPASGRALFTYDVIWTEDYHTEWSNRWDVYLSLNGAVPAKVHIVSIFNSLVITCALMALFACCVVKKLKDDIARYSDQPSHDEEVQNTTSLLPSSSGQDGWIRVYKDVFRPPASQPRLFALACGTGAQILATLLLIIVLGWLGVLNPARRGSLYTAAPLFFCLMGIVNGYVTARFYKTFFGQSCVETIRFAAIWFPSINLAVFLFLQLIFWSHSSTAAVPFATLMILFVLVLCIQTPLVYLGGYCGYQKDPMACMVYNCDCLPSPVPPQPCYVAAPTTLIFCGILPFGACFVETYYIMASFWLQYYYYEFFFLLVVFFLLIITTAQTTVLASYLQLRNGNHEWWWRAFGNAGSAVGWLFAYSCVYSLQLDIHHLSTHIIYFLTMAMVCFGLFCMLGFVGVMASLVFHKMVFSSVRIKLGYELLSEEDGVDELQMHDVTDGELAPEAANTSEEGKPTEE